MPIYLIPVVVLGGLLVLFGLLVILGRIRGGKYLKPVFRAMAKVPLLSRLLKRLSQAALERHNPELASAMRKLERQGALRDPQKAQKAISSLTAAERKAYMELAGEEEGAAAAVNRQQRRQLEKMRKGGGPTPQRRRGR